VDEHLRKRAQLCETCETAAHSTGMHLRERWSQTQHLPACLSQVSDLSYSIGSEEDAAAIGEALKACCVAVAAVMDGSAGEQHTYQPPHV
jgi:hypothetical protein